MKLKQRKTLRFLIFGAAILTGIWVIFSAMIVRNTGISIVTDKSTGAQARHGLDKLEETLRIKNIPFEEVTSIQKAKNQLLIVAGLAEADGDAAVLLKTGKHRTKKTAES